jgi:uncharacterized protein (TIGR03084 family)
VSDATSVRARRLATIRRDLAAEQQSLDDIVATITDDQWRRTTPSPGWNVADQIGHLAYFDASAARAILDPEGFHEGLEELLEAAANASVDEYTLAPLRALSPAQLLTTWRANRAALDAAASTLQESTRVPWYGPSMGAVSFLSARLMETWAHGTDVADALDVTGVATDRLVHVARLGFMTRSWSYQVRGETPPDGAVALDLTAPSGVRWAWGDEADDSVRGSAEEFCLVVTQRRHIDDTSLETGELGRHWLVRAQAFAGGPSLGPQPRSDSWHS